MTTKTSKEIVTEALTAVFNFDQCWNVELYAQQTPVVGPFEVSENQSLVLADTVAVGKTLGHWQLARHWRLVSTLMSLWIAARYPEAEVLHETDPSSAGLVEMRIQADPSAPWCSYKGWWVSDCNWDGGSGLSYEHCDDMWVLSEITTANELFYAKTFCEVHGLHEHWLDPVMVDGYDADSLAKVMASRDFALRTYAWLDLTE